MNVSPIATASAAKIQGFHQPEPQAEVASQTKPQRNSTASKPTSRNVEIDAGTQSVIFQTINDSTGEVISQYPSEVQLRVREYMAAVELASPLLSANSRSV